ncbi:xanthine dehydrogenase accessory protein XdhC [Ornithinimicrobium sp. Arc0846-15]|nr:xanthine dehydrogenase accessory protein XdhC [Ornithinimicrobium laminariae]
MTTEHWSPPASGADWLSALSELRAHGQGAVLATITEVRGHSPRDVGAKMVVTTETNHGSIGGGNMEATVIDRARAILGADASGDEANRVTTMTFALNEYANNQHGNQCCGGEVSVILEHVAARPVIAIFGLGHVGQEIARIMARHEVILHLTDSRNDVVDGLVADVLTSGPASVHLHTSPAPESVVATLPKGAHVLVLTHDHTEDLILCDAALRHGQLGTIGLIGSRAKWLRFHKELVDLEHPEAAVQQIQCPIGVPGIGGKHPGVIAVSVAADLLQTMSQVRS